MARLKLFKLTSGFHDSYVAAASRPAALKAWGARTDLFAMGAAEQVDDPAIMAKASKKPGEVLQKRRTKGAELEPRAPRKKADASKAKLSQARLKRELEAAERKLAQAETKRDSELSKLEAEADRIAARREAAAAGHADLIEALKDNLQAIETKLGQ